MLVWTGKHQLLKGGLKSPSVIFPSPPNHVRVSSQPSFSQTIINQFHQRDLDNKVLPVLPTLDSSGVSTHCNNHVTCYWHQYCTSVAKMDSFWPERKDETGLFYLRNCVFILFNLIFKETQIVSTRWPCITQLTFDDVTDVAAGFPFLSLLTLCCKFEECMSIKTQWMWWNIL